MQSLGTQRTYHGLGSLAVLAGLLGTTVLGGLGSLGDILGLGGSSAPTASTATTTPSGSLHMRSQKLRKGCKRYSYRYRLTVPSGDDFDLEIFVTDRRGVSQASDVILSGADPTSGVKHLTLCRSNTVPGKFALRGTLYTNDGSGPTTTTPLRTDHFRLWVHHHKHKKRHH
jgi:hypothetical protein